MSDDTIGNSFYDLLGDSKIVFNESGDLFVRIPWFGGYRDYYTTAAGTKEDWLSRQQANADGIATVHFSSDRNSTSLPQADPTSSTGLDATVVPVQTSNNKAVSADKANAGSEQSANGVADESGAVAMGSSDWTAELGSTVNGTKEKLTGVKLIDTFGINVNTKSVQGIGSSRIEPQYLVDPLNPAHTDREYFTEEELKDGVYYDEYTGMYTNYSGVPLFGEQEKFETRERVKEQVKEKLEESSNAETNYRHYSVEEIIETALLLSPLGPEVKLAGVLGLGLKELNVLSKGASSGKWVQVSESMSDASRAYQRQITGTDQVWLQNGVKFDGIKDGVLVEAKGSYANFVDKNTGKFQEWFKGKDSLIDQANRQLRASEGYPINWYFADEASMIATQKLFQREGITGINFIFKTLE